MRRVRAAARAIVIGVMAAGLLGACEKGPAEKAGEKIDDAVDKLSGKGPAEKLGERIDDATRDVRKN
jgi:hypothetical protein